MKKLSIIVPCYNEEDTVSLFYKEMEKIKKQLDYEYEYIFVDDGSSDNTLKEIQKLTLTNKTVRYISFSRNFGKEAALYAGFCHATGDFVTIMDSDLQDPPHLLVDMFAILENNPDIDCVGTRRATRKGEPLLRSIFAKSFYFLMNKISQSEIVDGARDFRLMRREMVNSLLKLSEYNRFSKGLLTWIGYNTEYIAYENVERVAGETSWNFRGLLSYSLEGIINFSDFPLRISSFLGILACLISVILAIVILIRTLLYGNETSGWTSMICIILFLSGLQFLFIGILGKYIGKIFLETKKRPIYIIKETEKDLNNE